ncbi:DNA internalization-related competence protein ComEC/Rec2 [Periweissella ghanensis]|uniref:ComE operon protein 3 n=1 Tax=Periweissella ghanensis TaxID=467997 RepID=A0ABM8ZA23_9LACO|nr:DNA internalization-related competence protein ComEC/Rec2 [Periweissella ghanensis]MCM0601758.1 DNA internalization-related competence protein ComEC/Rec2 [Periweissella ghanensis]CAH0418190.1 ComE operon protein 3 [Periweissella ghanensis]
MTNRWIFPALGTLVIAVSILGQYWWASVAVLVLFGRLCFLKEPLVVIVTMMIGGFFYCWINNFVNANQLELQQVQQQTGQSVTTQLTVWVDEYDVDGNVVKLIAQLPSTDTKLVINARIVEAKIQKQLQRATGQVTLTVKGRLQALDAATNPGQFDSRQFYALQKINATLSKAEVIAVTQPPTSQSINGWIHQARQNVLQYFEALPPALRYYGETLILGYIRADFYQANQGIRELGLLHLFSISGFQVTMLISLLTCFFGKLRVPTAITAVLILSILPLYYVFSGSIPSLIRAIIIGMLAQGLILLKWRVSALDTWSLSLLGGVFFEPGILGMLGGQLSYLLALALIFMRGLKFWQEIVMMNLVTLPVLLYTTYQTHLLAFLANFIFIPVFTHLIVPLTTLGVITYPIVPPVARGIDYLIAQLSSLITWLSKLPGNIIFGQFNWALALAATGLTFYLMQHFKSRRGWVGLLSLYAIGFIGLKIPLHGTVAFVDVGQGDSIVIQTPYRREVTLIDTGGRLALPVEHQWQQRSKQAKSNAEMFLVPYLMQQGIANIQQIILTHADADHAGDVEVLLKTFRVHYLYVGQGMESMLKYQQLALKYHVQLVGIHTGQQLPQLPLQVLWPKIPGQGKNEDSVVTRGKFGRLTFLFMGDLDRANELCIPAVQIKNTDVIKLGHHGSKTSSGAQFLETVQPQVAIISAGRDNRYHHPHEETLMTLAQTKIPYFSTARDGMIKYEWSLVGDRWSKMKSE